MEDQIEISVELLRATLRRRLVGAGYAPAEADIILGEFIDNEILGKPEFGLRLFNRIVADDSAKPKTPVVSEARGGVTIFDAGGRFAHIILETAIPLLVEGARNHGLQLVGIRNDTCFIKAGYPVQMLGAHGLIGICMICGGFRDCAPSGIGAPVFATNPLAIGIPAGEETFIYDSTTSCLSYGQLMRMRRAGVAAADADVGVDRAGVPTRVLEEVAALLPLGGDKGLGLVMAVELLAGSLLGYPVGAQKADVDDSGILILAIDPAYFGPADQFNARNEQLIRSLRELSGGAIHIPGERYRALRNRPPAISIDRHLLAELVEP